MPEVGIGIIGLGRATALLLPAITAFPGYRVVAVAEPRDELRSTFCADFAVRGYPDAAELCADGEVDLVYVASPHQFHARHVSIAARAGKHILVEKPMALSLEECDSMIQAAESAGVVLMVGHTNGYDAPVLAMRGLTLSRRFGRLRMLNAMHYSDFIYRPRRPEELDTDLGGGIMFNQFPHQVEMIRTISDAAVTKVSATCGVWDATRPTEGAVTALLHLAGDCVASIVYNGYAHLDSAGFYTGLDALGAGAAPFSSRHAIAGLTRTEEAEAKSRSGYLDQRSRLVHPTKPDSQHERFGLVIASYEHADVVPTPSGLAAYTDDGIELISVPFGTGALSRSTVMDEVAAAIAGVPPLHDGRWGRTTLEICLAALNSSKNDGAFRLLSRPQAEVSSDLDGPRKQPRDSD